MTINIVIDISPPLLYLVKFWLLKLWIQMLLFNQIAGFIKMEYLKKEVNDEFYFWHPDKHLTYLQADTAILEVHSQTCLKYPK